MKHKIQLLCIAMVLALLLSACQWDGWGLEIQNAEEIMHIFKEHETVFCEAADMLTQLIEKNYFITQSEEIHPYRTYNLYEVSGTSIYIGGDQVLSCEECQFIYNAVAPLFELCDIEHIAGYLTGKIEFMLEENAGQCAGLYHNPNGGEIKPGFGVVDELRINEFWYAATSSD